MHYHGTPITPRAKLLELAGRCFCVSYADPRDVEVCHEIGQSVMLDNGAFTIWQMVRDGKPVPRRLRAAAFDGEWSDYYEWARPWLDYRTTWAVIPDVIVGDAEANDALVEAWPFGARGAPVWHMHEPIERLVRLAGTWPIVCLGSSGAYEQVGNARWHVRMSDAMDAVCGDGPPPCALHMLRGLAFAGSHFPFASADATSIARNHAGSHAARVRSPRVMADEIDGRQCPARWTRPMEQLTMQATNREGEER